MFLALLGAGAVQGSILWWAKHHRVHHRYTDTSKDPYSVHKGLFFAHFGWMVFKQTPKDRGRTDISDLTEDAIVIWQHKNYLGLMTMFYLVFPTFVCGYCWHDWVGGFVYGGIVRAFLAQQATFCVNSLAHWLGEQPFDDRKSPRDHALTALVTNGEGYHNFHHEFPSDYRCGIDWWQYDPTKWSIYIWDRVGLAHSLKRFRFNEVRKGRFQQLEKRIEKLRPSIDWGKPIHELPVVSWDTFVDKCKNGESLTVIAGIVYDVAGFIKEHPGGEALISSGVGKDATAVFHGGVYLHSNAASNLLDTMRVSVLHGGCEIEVLKHNRMD
ncbi:hypothetical protein LLEC1_07849 [Akanthomyces lecanii]|uniref:stearoyl-CoA 9-desaturase n=1 Tax=Cordyceps confragosa TaxID=2714763 RepID=A0A179IBX8_CORDF|nr:hypothetical protein LLEC1_07849 [Akanthomyces lecanii]